MIDDIKSARHTDPVDTKTENINSSPSAEAFLTPEDVVAQLAPDQVDKTEPVAEAIAPADTSNEPAAAIEAPDSESKPPKQSHWPPTKKQLIIAGVVLVLFIGGASTWLITRPKHQLNHVATHTVVVHKKVAAIPTTVPSNLSGLPVSPSTNNIPVTGVMIENSTFARPQSGLGQASVVFEAIAEGGITRFLALYQDTSPANVGPIRSVRPYYEQWALGFDAAIAHVGGSPEALADIKTWNVRNLDQFYNGSYYHRITTREAPHNVYTSIALLNQLEASKGYTSSTFTSFPRKAADPSKHPTAAVINLTLSSSTYNVQYTYDATTNSYNRDEGGAPQIDANTNTQISPKVVIALVMPYSLEADGYHSQYGTIGSGPVYVFQDGTVTTGVWAKTSNTAQFTFKTTSGATIKLNPGQTWLTAVASTSAVSYTP